MAKTINELTLKMNADSAELKKQLNDIKGHLQGFQKNVSGIGNTFKSILSADIVKNAVIGIYNMTGEMVKLGGELAGTKMNFDKLNQPGLLDQLRNATGGTIADIELMKKALDADDMRVGPEALAKIMAYARNEVQETGGSVTELTDSIINSLGKGSTKALTQAGISIAAYKEEFKKTGDMATAVMNIITQKLKDSGKYIETSADITARWAARWENIKASIGLVINEGIKLIGPYLEEAWNWGKKLFDYLVKATVEVTNYLIDFINGWIDLYNESMLFRGVLNFIIANVKNMWEVFKLVGKGIWEIFSNIGEQIGYTLNPKNWGAGFADGLKKIGDESRTVMANIGKEFGKNIAENVTDGIKNTVNGKVKLIHIIAGVSSTEEIKEKGKDLGTVIGKGIYEGLTTQLDQEFADGGLIPELDNVELPDVDTSNLEKMAEDAKAIVSQMNEVIQTNINQMFVTIGTNLGDLFSGGSIKSAMQSLLSLLADFMGSFGKVLISIGVAKMALTNLFKAGPAGAFAAIAAGIALVSLSKVATNMMAKQKFTSGGIIGGYSYSGDHVPILANSGEMVLNAGQQASLFNQINSGGGSGGGSLTARVSGNDLLFVLEQSQKKRNYTY
jgi:predicted hydrocarbon binding protein